MGQKQFIPYETPSVVIRTIVPPRVLCTSNEDYTPNTIKGKFDDDSD